MPYSPDSFKASLIWGRIGAGVLSIVALVLGFVGYQMTPEDQASAYALVSSLIAGVAGVMAFVSKIRESKKAQE